MAESPAILDVLRYAFAGAVAVVLLVGVVMTARSRRGHGRAVMFGLGGFLLLLIAQILLIVWMAASGWIFHVIGSSRIDLAFLAFDSVSSVLAAAGIALLIAAIVARRPGQAATPPARPYSGPPAAPYQPGPPVPPYSGPPAAPYQPGPPAP